jgi:hypothetical protein
MRPDHPRRTEELIAVDKAFGVFKTILLRHSVQRPPYR